MKNMTSMGIKYSDNQLMVLDQQLLPHEEKWIVCESPDHMFQIIRDLKVRGAPLIGVAAALCLGHEAKRGASKEQLMAAAEKLRVSRPTAVNLMVALDRILEALRSGSTQAASEEAERIFDEDVELCQRLGNYGAELIQDGDRILTHCNTGGLATAGIGTALGVIQTAREQGKSIHVYVDETRPLLQGGRLTAWELEKLGVPYTLICDNMAAFLMQQKKVDKIFLGADRIATNGDFANKVGTYNLAVLAHHHGVPFYPVAPYTTVDFHLQTGQDIPIEERQADEVRGVQGHFGKVVWSPQQCATYNPAFDVTPASLVTSMVLDTGVLTNDDLKNGALKQRRL